MRIDLNTGDITVVSADITSTNALLGTVLDALGYTQKVDTLSVPITYQSLKNQQIDAFLGSWQPAQASMLDPLKAAGEVEVLNENLSGIRFTLAVPVGDEDALDYGMDATPTIVLIDRDGIVRMFHPGQMTRAELEPKIRELLTIRSSK